jgi:hypothetical protein
MIFQNNSNVARRIVLMGLATKLIWYFLIGNFIPTAGVAGNTSKEISIFALAENLLISS